MNYLEIPERRDDTWHRRAFWVLALGLLAMLGWNVAHEDWGDVLPNALWLGTLVLSRLGERMHWRAGYWSGRVDQLRTGGGW